MKWVVLLLASTCFAQDHKFFDKPAKFAFASSSAVFTTDAITTCTLSNHEDWLPARGCAGVSVWMVGNLAATFGTSYLLHKTRHHKLERIAEFIAPIGSAAGIAYTLRHRNSPIQAVDIIPIHSNPTFCIVGKPPC